jgi:ATP-dependent exoDNAse (exonuclease V) alpha subunit
MTTVELTENVRQQNKELKQSVNELAARNVPEAVAELHSRGKVIEIVDERERFEAIAQDYCKDPTDTLVISPANRERVQLNSLIHRQLQRQGNVSENEYQMKVYVTRSDMTGAERTFANSYRPGEDIIRYNRNSNKAKIGEYAQVIKTDHEKNEITVRFDNGRTLTYNPERLSGVSVYYESERAFAEGDRVQFRAPDTEKRIANGELGTITKIEPGQIVLALDSGRDIRIDPRKFRHLDYGYAVTSHSAQGLTCDRVLVNADTRESLRLLNDRMAYVAISRARYDAVIYTESAPNLGVSLDRSTNKESALEATQQQLPFEHSLDQSPTHIEPAQTQAAAPAIESRDSIARATHETLIHTESAQNLTESLNRNVNQVTALDDDRELKKDRDKLTHDSLASSQPLQPSDHNLNQAPSHSDPAPTKAGELEIESPELDLGGLIL